MQAEADVALGELQQRRVTTPPGAAFGTSQDAHTGVDRANTSAHSVTVAIGPTGDVRNIFVA